MFAWPGRASDAATIDAAVVGGTRSLAPSNSDRGEGSSEHRTAQERGIENREEVKRPLCCLRPPSSPHLTHWRPLALAAARRDDKLYKQLHLGVA